MSKVIWNKVADKLPEDGQVVLVSLTDLAGGPSAEAQFVAPYNDGKCRGEYAFLGADGALYMGDGLITVAAWAAMPKYEADAQHGNMGELMETRNCPECGGGLVFAKVRDSVAIDGGEPKARLDCICEACGSYFSSDVEVATKQDAAHESVKVVKPMHRQHERVEEGYELNTKRMYLPVDVTRLCPVCDSDLVFKKGQDYLSYPTVGAKSYLYRSCDNCGTDLMVDVVLELGMHIAIEVEKQ